jgi:hypothetical protein
MRALHLSLVPGDRAPLGLTSCAGIAFRSRSTALMLLQEAGLLPSARMLHSPRLHEHSEDGSNASSFLPATCARIGLAPI